MTFQYDYFSHNIPNWTKILKKFKNKDNIRALEIGCFEGRATKWLLENILTKNTSSITVIDTFEGSIENKDHNDAIANLLSRFKENIKNFKNKVYIFKDYSSNILKKIKTSFDIIYIDGSHMAKDVLEDAVLSWRLLKTNGILIFDDYEWDFYKNEEMCPKIAIDSFLKVYKNQYKIINIGYQVYIKKIGENIIKSRERGDNSKKEKTKPSPLELEIKKLKKDLKKIQSSKTYILWQKYNKIKRNILNKK